MSDAWTVERVGEGWRVHYDGQPFTHDPKPTEREARAYADRLQRRYRGGSAGLFCNSSENGENDRQRGGPWRWRTPEDASTVEEHGATGVIHTSRLEDAKSVLRHRMKRQRLPNGITWELETGT